MKKRIDVFVFILFLINSYSLFGAFSVTSVSPSNGSLGSEEMVTLQGTGFNEVTNIFFGSSKTTNFTLISDNLINVQTPVPLGPAGMVHVKVGNSAQQSSIAFNNRFTFTNGYWLGYAANGISTTTNSLLPFNLSEGVAPGKTFINGFTYNLAISQNGARLYAPSTDYLSNNSLVILDIAKNQIINQISLSAPPLDVAINSTGKLGYVIYGNQLAEINLLFSMINWEMALPYAASQMIISPDNTKAYITHYYNNSLSIVDLATKSITNSIRIERPYALAIHPDGKTVYICTDNRIGLCMSTADDSIIAKFSVGFEPYSIAVNPNGQEAYVANFAGNNITILDLLTNQPKEHQITVGKGPISIAITPDGKIAYVANSMSSTVTSIDLTTYQTLDNIVFNDYPYSLVITPDQSPIANFEATLATPQFLTVNFDASSSITPVGEIAEYAWIFESNDLPNSIVTTASPTISHTFSTPGEYSVTLTVTNTAGTSTTQIFTGNTMSRNGSYLATITKLVNVPWPPQDQ